MKSFLLWLFAVIITLSAAWYQRITGPTYPKRIMVNVENQEYKIQLKRSEGEKDCAIELPVVFKDKVKLYYKRYKIDEPYMPVDFIESGKESIIAYLPQQPPAGKLQYYIIFKDGLDENKINGLQDVVIRFKGDVPAWALIPHIIFIFFAMLLSNLTGLMAIFTKKSLKKYIYITFILLLAGGMIMGPVVQKFAFGEFWTGVPFGWDLTDNKTLIAFVFWLIALIGNFKKPRPFLIILASIMTIVIFSIPHSMFGSELNYETGVVTQG